MLHAIEHALEHTLKDSIILIIFLFLTYLVMEYLEHRTGEKVQGVMCYSCVCPSRDSKRIPTEFCWTWTS